MAMNERIRERRKALGLTQEKVAEYLGVTAPAVNKWEKGTTCPDIQLLPALARLLKTDLNTLLCFKEELTEQEIFAFGREVAEAVRDSGLDAGFVMVRDKVREYPACASLIHHCALILDGAWIMVSGADLSRREAYEDELMSLYERAAECGDEKIASRSRYMLAGKYRARKEYERAQQMLDLMPEREALDKGQLQANLYIAQGKFEEAARLLEPSLVRRLNEVQGILFGLAEIAEKEGRLKDAAEIGERWKNTAKQMGLWDYVGLVIPLQNALDRQEKEESIRLIKELFSAALKPWKMGESPLYRHIAGGETKENIGKKMLPAFLFEVENGPQYEFLRDEEELKQLIEFYRAKC